MPTTSLAMINISTLLDHLPNHRRDTLRLPVHSSTHRLQLELRSVIAAQNLAHISATLETLIAQEQEDVFLDSLVSGQMISVVCSQADSGNPDVVHEREASRPTKTPHCIPMYPGMQCDNDKRDVDSDELPSEWLDDFTMVYSQANFRSRWS